MKATPTETTGQPIHHTPEHPWLDAGLLLGITTLLAFTWNAAIWTPLKILVVFFHEGSHALAAILTGGSVLRMEIIPNQGGSVLSQGGSAFAIVTAGYLGSLVIGALLLVLASHSRADRWIMGLLALSMALLSVSFVRNLYGLGFGFGGAIAGLVSAYYFSDRVNDFLLRLIGLTSMIYVPLDIFSDTLARPHLHSDAKILADLVGGSTQMWGFLWLALSVPIILMTLWVSLKAKK
jgi:hypothetical protein